MLNKSILFSKISSYRQNYDTVLPALFIDMVSFISYFGENLSSSTVTYYNSY
jgi:hypothetical protein